MNDKNPQEAEHAQATKALTATALCANSWQDAVKFGHSILSFNSSALRPREKRKIDLGGLPEPFVKGIHIATGGGFSFLPGFLLKFQIKMHLEKILDVDQQVSAIGVGSLASLPRNDLLELCMDRGLGDPTWSAPQLVQGASSYYGRLRELEAAVKLPPGFAVCPYRARLALLAVNSVSSVRSIAVTGDLTRKLYTGPQTVRLGY